MNMNQQMWTEQYRPTTLDDVVGQDAAVDRFNQWLDEGAGALPHILMSGPAGVGKTAVAASFARDLYGDSWNENFREFNASDERGIDDVREQIKTWCRKAPADGYSFKIVFLDEADSLTKDAQSALRRIMEQYSDSTRFIMSCNYVTKLIGPLQSRCSPFHFSRLADDEIRELVEGIAEEEDVLTEEPAVDKVVRSARGQARDAVLTLQTSVIEGELREDQVELITGVVDDALVKEILELALTEQLDDAQRRLDVEILKAGADPHALLDSVFRVLRKLDLQPDSRAKCFDLLGTIEERLQMGLNPHVQFHALLCHLFMAQGLSAMGQQKGDVQ